MNKSVYCPYRICPLGAHSDHQYGKITGLAIDKGIRIEYRISADTTVHMESRNFPNAVSFELNSPMLRREGDWADYIRGAALVLAESYTLRYGIDGVIFGELPVGGLSSSAAVIIAFLTALCEANEITLEKSEMIRLAMLAENRFVGVKCGSLDQSCEVYSQKDHLLYLDTLDGSFVRIPQPENMPAYEIAVFFSGLERTLVGSKFNMRVDEMKTAAYALMAYAGMEYGKFEDARLRRVPVEVYEQYKDRLPVQFQKRAEHFYSEFRRVEQGAEAWKNGDLVRFGQLIFESGHSSIYNYETGSPELIKLYEIMRETKGIYGGRFSGAGFKGCSMALIDPTYKDEIAESVREAYLQTFPHLKDKFSVHFCKSADGVQF
ncbi:MAG: GHMP kinase [Candidatus Fimenecus sp.]